MPENKRKKHHDKDKYYRLAKEQGYRSRAAFKLTQINRKFSVLKNARTVLDLCAAPGGWTQVVSRALPMDASTTIVAVDILPIRRMKNVITLVGDITTEKCKAAIRQEMQGAGCDVVLHDGAPNVGASYDRDAYQQNEIALHALKCASEHLKKDGTFVTKLYRSQDYSAYLWVAKQFFRAVQAVKPSASRSQSAEIFLVCEGYIAPDKIDSRMFDPGCVFEQIDGQATGGGDKTQTGEKASKVNIFHKEFGKRVRNRNGYDMTGLDASMRKIGSVAKFLEGGADCDPIQMLSDCTGLAFVDCDHYLNHRLTTPEVKTCLSDLKVLNKADFRGLMTWRDKMRAEKKALTETKDGESDASSGDESAGGKEPDSDAEDEKVQSEIEALRHKKVRLRKRAKKKERELAAKRRKRAAFGMDLNAIDVPDNDKIFSLATITNARDLELVREVDLDKVTMDQLGVGSGDDGDSGGSGDDSSDDEDGKGPSLERELDGAYDRYLANTRDGMAKSGTKMAKRTKKLQRQKALEEAREDAELVSKDAGGISGDTKAYAELLEGGRRDSDDDDDSDDYDSEEDGKVIRDGSDKMKVAAKKGKKGKKGKGEDEEEDKSENEESSGTTTKPSRRAAEEEPEEEENPLLFRLADDPAAVKTSRWFGNPLFESIENAARSASFAAPAADEPADDEEDEVRELDSDDEDRTAGSRKKARRASYADGKGAGRGAGKGDGGNAPLDPEDIIASMPKTDKQKRHEKRLKSMGRMERRNTRRERAMGAEGAFKVAPGAEDDEDLLDGKQKKNMTENEKKKMEEARALIKAGMGSAAGGVGKEKSGFEVVSALPVLDSRKYDSENEDYDSDDHARTLALGTMILRKSKEKSMVDASYNRYAWNDPSDLPDWFVDDETKHYRPQLPIPQELVEKMKAKYLHLATKPIAKVAEARARKGRMAKTRLAAAKKKAEAVANSSEMTEATKLKAISRAMRGKEASKPGKTYVVSKKGGGGGGKGIKLVDRRERSDKRATERITKKKKNGKKGGLTGSKRRRNHK